MKTYFSGRTLPLSLETVEDILNVLRGGLAKKMANCTLVDALWDLFASGEVISELTFLVQLLTLMASINDQNIPTLQVWMLKVEESDVLGKSATSYLRGWKTH